MKKNPFKYVTPQSLTIEEVNELFVSDNTQFNRIKRVGHTIIHGAMGSGKSMLFRFMHPECLAMHHNISITELDYFSFYIPIKEGHLKITEMDALQGLHGELLLTEHMMVIYVLQHIFMQLEKMKIDDTNINRESFKSFYENDLKLLLGLVNGESYYIELEKCDDLKDSFSKARNIFKQMHYDFFYKYVYKIRQQIEQNMTYDGPLCLYGDFLCSLLESIQKLEFVPNKPIYLLLDDADNMNEVQTKVLNTWISQRTIRQLSIKITTQRRYKNYDTTNNLTIKSPHDFYEIDLSELYTASSSEYTKKVNSIVQKRLNKYGYLDTTPEEFFPENKKQREKINHITTLLEQKKDYQFARRNAVPEYIKSLGKNSNYYSYSGFNSIVNLSSGVVRIFIDFAARMVEEQQRTMEEYSSITPKVQDHVLKSASVKYVDNVLYREVNENHESKENIDIGKKLRNLVDFVGNSFNQLFYTELSERRIFSFAVKGEPNEELSKVLQHGLRLGVFHKSFVSNKSGTGKTRVYLLNRILAPHYKLDPTSIVGYKFISSELLNYAMYHPEKCVLEIKKKGQSAFDENIQMSLFDS